MSKSGTLSYEAGYRLAQRGVGTSVWIGVGGDPVKGTRYADLVPFYAADAQTEALLIIGEIGGSEEEEFAQALDRAALREAGVRADRRPQRPEGVTMGHAGALVHGSHGTYAAKRAALEAAGVTVFGSLGEMVAGVRARAQAPPSIRRARRLDEFLVLVVVGLQALREFIRRHGHRVEGLRAQDLRRRRDAPAPS